MGPPFLTWALDGGEWLASRLSHFIPRVRTPGTHLIGGWVEPRAGLDAMVKRKIACFCRESNHGLPARSPSQYRLS
jgi:hypothetical protein